MLPFFLGVAIFPPTFCTPVLSFYHSAILSSSSSTFEDSNVHRPVYFYIEKNSKCPFFGYLYKLTFELSNTRTPIHPYTKFCAQIPCSDFVLKFHAQILCSNSVLKFYAIILIIKLSYALWGIIRCTQRSVGDYSSIFFRSGLDYSSIFPVVAWITHPFFP